MKKLLFSFVIACTFFASCKKTRDLLPAPSGKPGEVLVVIDDPILNSIAGDTLMGILKQDVVGLPWNESFYDVSRINRSNFSNLVKVVRNIIEVDVSENYSSAQAKYFKEVYSKHQAYIKLQAPNIEALYNLILKEGNKILSYIYAADRNRFIISYKKNNDPVLSGRIRDSFNIDMIIPSQFNRSKFKKDFAWLSSGNIDARQDLVIYSYPYVDKNTFSRDYIIKKRDSVLKANIPGSIEGSFMSTEKRSYPAVYTAINKKDQYVGELRGLWETIGDMMGGPFVSHSFLDDKNQTVITVEGFIYAPDLDKRTMMRQLEALIYSATVSKEDVKAEKK